MRKLAVIAGVMLVPSVALAWPWSTDMMNQPSIKPQEGTMVPFPSRSIPVQGIPTQVADREAARDLKNPIDATSESIAEGRTLFKIYCGACHGNTGAAESPVAGKIGAPALVDNYYQEMTDGWVWGTITFGSYVMPSYGVPTGRDDNRGSNDLSVEERWHVVNYFKHGMKQDATQSAAAQ